MVGRLYRYKLEPFLSFRIILGLLAGPERQRLGKLDRHPAEELVYVVDPTDIAVADEIRHIERVIRLKARNTEPSGNVLAGTWTTVVGVTGKGRTGARNIDHLTL
jgi:hypothetical protein